MNHDKQPLLVAYRDESLSEEAAQQLIALSEDTSSPSQTGEDLPMADKAALLRKAAIVQSNR